MAARFSTDGHSYLGLTCDTCGREAPPASEILAGHGLQQMGWHCSGGTHICPTCAHPELAE